MNSWFGKFAGVAAMATVLTAAGWGLGSGMAQARPHPTPVVPHPNTAVISPTTVDQFQDRFFPEGTRADTFFDHFLRGVK